MQILHHACTLCLHHAISAQRLPVVPQRKRSRDGDGDGDGADECAPASKSSYSVPSEWRCGPYKNQPCVNPMQRTNEDGQCVVPREQFDRFTTTHGRALASASGAWTKTALKSTTGQTASSGGIVARRKKIARRVFISSNGWNGPTCF